MPYKKRSLEQLRKVPAEFRKKYTHHNPARLASIAPVDLIVKFTLPKEESNRAANLITAATLFALECVGGEYTGLIYSWLSPKRSTAYSLLMEELGIDENNPFPDDERLSFLTLIYKYIDERFTDNNIKALNFLILQILKEKGLAAKADAYYIQDKAALVEKILNTIERLMQRDSERIARLIHKSPELNALEINLKKLDAAYKLKKQNQGTMRRWLHNSNREKMLELGAFVLSSCMDVYPANRIDELDKMRDDKKKVIQGYLLFPILEIRGGYKLTKPEGGFFNQGSDLFRLNMEALNGKIPANTVQCLEALSDHIQYYKERYPEKFKTWSANIENFQVKIQKLIEKEKSTTLTAEMASTAASYGTQAILGYVAAQMTITNAGAMIGLATAVAAAGPIGIALAALAGATIMTPVTRWIFATLISKIPDRIGEKTAEVVDKAVKTKSNPGEALLELLTLDQREIYIRWVNSLLLLPARLVSEEDKKRIRNAFGLEENQMLQRLPIREPEEAEAEPLVARIANAIMESGYLTGDAEEIPLQTYRRPGM